MKVGSSGPEWSNQCGQLTAKKRRRDCMILEIQQSSQRARIDVEQTVGQTPDQIV